MRTNRCTTPSSLLALLTALPCVAAQPPSVELVSQRSLPTSTTDQAGVSFTVAGLSGICRRPDQHDDYIAVMDNSNKLVFIRALIGPAGEIISATFTGGLTLAESRDFEAISITPDGLCVLLGEEGTPAIHEYSLASGQRLRTLPLPSIYTQRRANFGNESLAASIDHHRLWTANEEALTPDGPLSTPSLGTLVRIQRLLESGGSYAAAGQFAYRCDPIHGIVISGSRSGVSELLHVPELDSPGAAGGLLVLERSLALASTGLFRSRLYMVDTNDATDTSSRASLASQPPVPARKTLLWSASVNNLEGLALGPALAGPGRCLLGIIDDGDPISVNALVSLRLTFPSCAADFNADGGVDGADVDAFFAAWEQGLADVNSDGGVDGDDVGAFFALWESGGCS